MRYLFAHRTRRIVFLFILLPSATLAYITLPRGDVRLPAENIRARTQDIAISAGGPSVVRGKFMEPPGAYVSQGPVVRTPADEAAISELALTAAAAPDPTARLGIQTAPQVTESNATIDTSTKGAGRSRSSSGSRAYPQLLARGMESAVGVAGSARPGAAATTATSPLLTTTAAEAVTSSSGATPTTASTSGTSNTSSGSSSNTQGTAAPPAVAGGGQIALENTEDTEAAATVAHVFSGPAAGAGGNGNGNGAGTGGSPIGASPSSTPEPATLLLISGGLALMYGARKYVH